MLVSNAVRVCDARCYYFIKKQNGESPSNILCIVIQTRSVEKIITNKMNAYYDSRCNWKIIDRKSDPIMWWREHYKTFPAVSSPASSADSERLYFEYGNIIILLTGPELNQKMEKGYCSYTII